jgi:hypothetical protein
MERVSREHPRHTRREPTLPGPDGTWGYIAVVLCSAFLAFTVFISLASWSVAEWEVYVGWPRTGLDELGDSPDKAC